MSEMVEIEDDDPKPFFLTEEIEAEMIAAGNYEIEVPTLICLPRDQRPFIDT